MLLHRFKSHRRLVIGLVTLVAIIVLFGLLGYFWLPGYAKAKLETLLTEAVHRPVTVQSIDIQPYTLELTVRGFRVGEKEADIDAGKALFSVDELYVNLSAASIARRAPVISSISIKAPALRLVREDENRFNITDLIEDFMNKPEEGGETMFSVSNIVIEGGRFEFVDRLKKSHQDISEITVGIPFIANFENDEKSWVEPHFSAKINGAPLTLRGRLRPFTQNREATLELKLKDVDLVRIDEYSPVPLGISLVSGYFDSDLLLTFTQIDGQAPNMVLTGQAALRKFEIENRSVEVPYTAKLAQLEHFALALAEVALIRNGDPEPVLSLPKLNLDKVMIDTERQSVALGALTLDHFKGSVRRDADGRLDLVKLFSAPPDKADTKLEAAPSTTKKHKPWTAQLGSVQLIAAALRFEDHTLPNVVPMVVNPLDLTLSDIDLNGVKPLRLALKAEVNKDGNLETKGLLAWAPLMVDLAINAGNIDLVALQGWAGDQWNALLTSGSISFDGNVKVDGSPLKVALSGESRFTDFNVLQKTNMAELMRWRSLDVSGIQFVNDPLRVDINSIAIANFLAHVLLTSKGELNFKHIVAQNDGTEPSGQIALDTPPVAQQQATSDAAAKPVAKNSSKSSTKSPLPVHIGRIVITGGNVNFHDQFIKPNYRAKLTGLAGRVGPLDPRKPGKIDIRGAVDKTAPLKIVGTVNTLGSELFLDVTASAKGIDMPTFSPYSRKYIGYAIEKGKLSVDIHYHVEKGELKAENNIFLDQLTLGEKVESPDALSIPVSLALALLKNQQGEIDVHMPISGSINDPEFSLGGLIIKVFINLITKAATAPFAMLGSLFGGEELSEIDFSPGYADITPEAEKRLEVLSKALTDRPALELEIAGYADPAHDSEALKRMILERTVKAQKLSESVKKGETVASLDDVELTPDEYEKYLTVIYKDSKFAKPKNFIGFLKSLPVPEMEQLLLASIDAGDSEMRELAERRAEAARDWLVVQGGVPSERVFVLAPKVETEASSQKSGSRAEFSLK